MDDANDWVFLTDETTGQSYWANTVTRETSWSQPEALRCVEGAAVEEEEVQFVKLSNGWYRYEDDETGRPYYYHMDSQETRWTMPPEARPPEPTDAFAFGQPDTDEEDESGRQRADVESRTDS